MKAAADILSDLVAIPSVSHLSNRPMIDYAMQYLKGWIVDLHSYQDPAGVEKVNLVARSVPARVAELALVCHTDTVPFDPAWDGAVNPVVRHGKLYGRGSCDVKGFLACVLASISTGDVRRLEKPLMIVLTADEEAGCVGAKFLARKKAVRARYTIVGEPTGLHAVRAGKGYALAEIVVRGKEAHSAFPARGRSAIYDAARVVLGLERIAKKLAARRNRDFDPPFTTLNVGVIQGGTAKNIVAGECRITVEWRPIPGQDPQWAARLIREELKRLGTEASFEIKRIDPPFEPAKTHELSELLESLAHSDSTTVSFGTEAAHLGAGSRETIVFGPGDMTVAHKSGEFVPVAELNECVFCLISAIAGICGTVAG